MNRWTVKAHQSHRNGSKCPKSRWVVDPPGFDYRRRAEHTGNWHRAGGKWFQWGGETTKREAWEEALAYADRMARSVQIELPRSAHTSTQTMTTRPVLDGLTVTFTGPGDSEQGIHITREELKPLALALLAHHYKQEQPDLHVTYYMPDGKKEKHTANTQHLDQHALQLLANYYEQEQA